MEKDQFLGPYHKAIGLIILLFVLASCAMPKIILLRDPLTPEEHINLGVSYEKNGEHQAALDEYKLASRRLPVAHLYIGNIFFELKDLEEAEKAYKLAVSKTEDPRAYNNLAWLYYTSDRSLEDAEALARRAVGLSPEDQDFQDTLTRILEKKRNRVPTGY